MSDEEINACYYNSRDYSYFRDRERKISRNFSSWGSLKMGWKGDYLGVESRLQRFHRRQRGKNAVVAVILEQELRQENDSRVNSLHQEDDLAIARVYKQYTEESARLARERAATNTFQVDKNASSLLTVNRNSVVEMKTEKGEDATNVVTIQFELPWEVPDLKKRTNKNCRADIIKYATSSHHIIARNSSEISVARTRAK